MEKKQRIDELIRILNEANYLYYVQDNPVVHRCRQARRDPALQVIHAG